MAKYSVEKLCEFGLKFLVLQIWISVVVKSQVKNTSVNIQLCGVIWKSTVNKYGVICLLPISSCFSCFKKIISTPGGTKSKVRGSVQGQIAAVEAM